VLIIRRRRGESITVGDDVEIEILETSPTQVKLGIRAPKSVSVLRKEIIVTREQNRVASGSPAVDDKLNTLAEQYRIAEAGMELPDPATPVTVEVSHPPALDPKRNP
jgi:carbon storage regulator